MSNEQQSLKDSTQVVADVQSEIAVTANEALRAEAQEKNSGIKLSIGTCPECSPPFEWPPNEPKEPKDSQPKDKPVKKES